MRLYICPPPGITIAIQRAFFTSGLHSLQSFLAFLGFASSFSVTMMLFSPSIAVMLSTTASMCLNVVSTGSWAVASGTAADRRSIMVKSIFLFNFVVSGVCCFLFRFSCLCAWAYAPFPSGIRSSHPGFLVVCVRRFCSRYWCREMLSPSMSRRCGSCHPFMVCRILSSSSWLANGIEIFPFPAAFMVSLTFCPVTSAILCLAFS